MNLYGQEPEARLLGAFLARLDHRSLIDIGAERGGFTQAMLERGALEVHAVEPEPANAASLRDRFRGDERVSVLEVAIGDADGTLELHTSVDSTGDPLPFGHTVLVREDTDEISWAGTITVPARSLASLVAAGEIPRRVGILKVDTEGHDLAVVSGMGALDCDVIMVEHWRHLPHSLGACPWTADEMIAELAPRGFAHFALVVHAGEFVILKWDDAGVDDGAMGNLVFVHDRVLPRLLPDLLDTASRLAAQTVAVGRMYAEAAADRLAVVEHLDEELRRRRGVVAKLFGGRSPLEGLDR